jgi:HAE1 family hydrophobic/amphiphilic exporter-1
MEVGTRLELVDRQARLMEADRPAGRARSGLGGPRGRHRLAGNAGAEGEIRLSLVPAAQRDRSNVAIAEDLRRRLAGRVPGMEIRVRAPQGQFCWTACWAAMRG